MSVFDAIDAELARRPDADPLRGQAVNDRRGDDRPESAGIEAASETAGETGSSPGDWECVGDVEPEAVTWLWTDRIPLGKLTLLAGDPGLGKSATPKLSAGFWRGIRVKFQEPEICMPTLPSAKSWLTWA